MEEGGRRRGTITFLKKNWSWIILLLILGFGFYLRAYHIDYPVVGYHNWKETHYLTEARNFARDGFLHDGLFMPHSDLPYFNTNPNGIHKDTFPTISIIIGALFKIFGYHLWIARIVNVLFSLGAIFFSYLLIKKLFNREDLAIVTALIMSFMPLLVFFGRQVQLINPALFFMIFGAYYYLKWIDSPTIKNLLLFSLGTMLSIITKYSFALILIPMAYIFPWKQIKPRLKQCIISFFVFLLIPIWMFYNEYISKSLNGYSDQEIGNLISVNQITLFFKSEFWTIMRSYIADNYTLTGLLFLLVGLGLFIFLKKKSLGYKFFIGYGIGLIPWLIVMVNRLKGHSYHQYPLLLFVAFMISFAIIIISTSFSSVLSTKYRQYIKIGIILILLFIIYTPSKSAWERQFDTQFVGLDLAGEYVKENSLPTDRIIHSRHQSFGILWHADRKGENPPTNLTILNILEERGANWIFIYQWGFAKFKQSPEVWDYIIENYSLAQIAFSQTQEGAQPVYFLLKKGGSFNESQLNEYLQNKTIKTKNYETTKGLMTLNYINI